MAQNKFNVSSDNVSEWLASTGFLFPRNEVELDRYETLYKEDAELITDNDVNVERILNGVCKPLPVTYGVHGESLNQYDQYRMAARKGGNLPNHILDKMKKNQENRPSDDNSSPEETNQ